MSLPVPMPVSVLGAFDDMPSVDSDARRTASLIAESTEVAESAGLFCCGAVEERSRGACGVAVMWCLLLMNRISDSMQDTRKSRRTDAKNPIAAGFEIAWVDAHTSLMPRCPRRPEPLPPLLRMKATRQTTTIHMLDRHMHTRASR